MCCSKNSSFNGAIGYFLGSSLISKFGERDPRHLITIRMALIKQYDTTGIGAIVAPTAKNTISKNHPKEILHDENHPSIYN